MADRAFTVIDGQVSAIVTPPATDDLQAVLHDTRAFVHRYVRLSSEQATLAAIWIAMTHVLDCFDYVPYLHISSPLPECGKSRLLEVLEALVHHPWLTARVSAAVLMRKIDKEHPTLLLDESDAAFSANEEYSEALRGALNAGFHRSGTTSVCIGQGANLTPKDFSVFGPKAIAGIGRLPSTVESRSIPMLMKRRAKGEVLDKWRRRDGWAAATILRDRLSTVMAHHREALAHARPAMPDQGLSDRAEDVLEPLFAIADAAGGDWPAKVRTAAVALMGDVARKAREAEQNLGLELLGDIRRIFSDEDRTELGTKELIDRLVTLDDRPWGTFGRNEKPITGHRLSRLLKGFDIQPAGQLWVEGRNVRGYRRVVFEDAFARYLGSEVLERGNVNETGHESAETEVLDARDLALVKRADDLDKHCESSALALSFPDHEDIPALAGPAETKCEPEEQRRRSRSKVNRPGGRG